MAQEPIATPINRPAIPVGTVAEAEAEGLDPALYATCARPNPRTGIVGCSRFERCIVSARGESGPKNYGFEQIKSRAQGGSFVRNVADCMWIADHNRDIVANGGSLRIIADEGGTFEKVTGVAVDVRTGNTNLALKGDPNSKDPNYYREDRRITVTVPRYPRPKDNPELLQDMLRAEAAEQERVRIADETARRNYGLESTIPAIDKRDGRGAEGRAKAKGGVA